MSPGWMFLAIAVLRLLASPEKPAMPPGDGTAATAAEEPPIVIKMPERKKTGRLGELTLEEEAKLDKIIQDFIQHDLGVRGNPASVKQLEALGAEAIPALVRGVNQSANYSHSCPVTVLSAKLASLIRRSDDPQVLAFIRAEIGAGVKSNRYNSLLSRLKSETSLRQAKLRDLAKQADRSRPESPGTQPGSGKDP